MPLLRGREACARPVLAALVVEGWIRLVFRNFPLTEVHPYALIAALAAEAAGAQGQFWADRSSE